MRFTNKTVVVTGAARGIGLATARRFAEDNASVAIVDVLSDEGERAARELGELGRDVRFLAADVTDPDQVAHLIASVVRGFGSVDVLVNNAAITLPKSFEETTPSEWDDVQAANLRSAYLCMRSAAPFLKQRDGASVVNVSSFHARSTLEQFGAYAAAKAGLIGLTQSAALDLAPHGVRVNAICPGIIETAMWQAWMDQVDDPRGRAADVLRLQPLGRIGKPVDVANAIAFLASAEAAYITGTTLYVDGGVTARLHHVFGS